MYIGPSVDINVIKLKKHLTLYTGTHVYANSKVTFNIQLLLSISIDMQICMSSYINLCSNLMAFKQKN